MKTFPLDLIKYENVEILFPSVELIKIFHEQAIIAYQDDFDPIIKGNVIEGNLFHVIDKIKYHVGNEGDFNRRLFDKAACLMHGLITSHAFKDGNKRTSFIITSTFLSMNNKRQIMGTNEYEDSIFLKKIAKTKFGDEKAIKELRDWLIQLYCGKYYVE